MSIAFRNEIDVTVSIARGAIAAVEILPRTRPPLTRLFAGKEVASLLSVLPRLFSLCAVAHQVAFLAAVEAARGAEVGAVKRQDRIASVIAERLTELLRGLFVGRLVLDSKSAAAVRAMMQAIPVLRRGLGESGDGPPRRDAVLRVKAALAALGISGTDAIPAPGSALALHISSLEVDALNRMSVEQTFLSIADDRNVIERLLEEGAGFSESPDLGGRIPETGVWARSASRKQPSQQRSGPAARLQARVAEIARLCAWLEAGEERATEPSVVESYSLGSGRGAAAVECARGRLYHAVELDRDWRIARFEFLAPTEWNFHARGPLVRTLQGAVLAGSRRGQDAIRAMVGSFDPCVGFSINFREVADA